MNCPTALLWRLTRCATPGLLETASVFWDGPFSTQTQSQKAPVIERPLHPLSLEHRPAATRASCKLEVIRVRPSAHPPIKSEGRTGPLVGGSKASLRNLITSYDVKAERKAHTDRTLAARQIPNLPGSTRTVAQPQKNSLSKIQKLCSTNHA